MEKGKAHWSSSMILASGVSDPGFNSRMGPFHTVIYSWNGLLQCFDQFDYSDGNTNIRVGTKRRRNPSV